MIRRLIFQGRFLEGKKFSFKKYSHRIVLPIFNRDFNRLTTKEGSLKVKSNRRGIKTFDNDNKMHWMGSSINLSQPDIYNIKVPKPMSNRNSSEDMGSRRSDLNSTRSQKHFGNTYLTNGSLRRSLHNHRSSNILQKSAMPELRYINNEVKRSESFGTQYGNVDLSRNPDWKNRSLKSRYQTKVKYISSPLRQMKAPIYSTSQDYF